MLSLNVCVCSAAQCVQLFATPGTVAHQAPLSMEFFQARILEWVAISFSRGSSRPRNRTRVSGIEGGCFTNSAIREGKMRRGINQDVGINICSPPGLSVHGIFPGKNSEVGCHFLHQGIFPTQGSNLCLLHWQASSLLLSHLGSPGRRLTCVFAHLCL